MPGVVVTTATKAGPAGNGQAPSGQAFFVGLMERGDVSLPVIVNGMADVERLMGDRPSYGALYDQLKVYFDEGGTQAVVARVVGSSATVGTLTLMDRAGTPLQTLRVDAANPGIWSTDVTVEVLDGSATDTFRIKVSLDGTVVEDLNNLRSPAEAASKFATSPYIRVSSLGSATSAPNNNPAVMAATALSAGTDDRNSVTSADYVSALDRFNSSLGDGAVAIPGQTGSTIWNAIIAHCETNNRIGILAAPQGETSSTLQSDAAGLDTEFAGLFAPWVVVSDGGYGTRTISPEGYVMACRNRAHQTEGPWRLPAGQIAKAVAVLDLDQDFTSDEGNDLSTAKVSVIRKIANSVRLYDWRSLSTDEANYYYLKDRDTLNRIVVEALITLEAYVFQTIDSRGKLLSALGAEIVGMVDPIRAAGGLYELLADDGTVIDPGYRVDTGSTLNTRESLATNTIKARLSVRVSPAGGLVELNITKVGLLSGI